MREQGRLIEWNDERGFGFVVPLNGDSRAFAHVSEFPHDQRRPMATDLVTYEVVRDERGRLQAQHIEFLAPAHARHEDSRGLSIVELALPALFTLTLLVLAAIGTVPWQVPAFYTCFSTLAFAMYKRDKKAATLGQWRVSEAKLIGIAAIGGWPGAYLARHLFRHKTRKQPFRTYFWLAVGLNCGLLVLILSQLVPALR